MKQTFFFQNFSYIENFEKLINSDKTQNYIGIIFVVINFMKTIDEIIIRRTYDICPDCGNFQLSELSENPGKCHVCGSDMIRNCPNCNAPIYSPAAKFCTKCGTILKQKT